MKPICLLPVDPWLAHLEDEIRALQARSDPEDIHQLRIAAGRLSVWLELDGRRALRDDLRWLRGSAAPVRDLDVLRAKDRSASWNSELAARREQALAGLREALAAPRLQPLIAALRLVPAPAPERALAGLARLERRVLRAGERLLTGEAVTLWAGGAHDAEALHRLRRRVRRLRYALEWVGRDADQVKALQDALGCLNDLAVERACLDASSAGREGQNGAVEHHALIESEFASERARALDAWCALAPRVGHKRARH